MADIKGFYKQKKKNGVAKPTTNSKKSVTPKLTQSPTLISHFQDDYDGNEELLRQFDLNMAYGPCLGLSRLDRWERAKNLGLNPPRDVEPLLRSDKVRNECLWDGRV